MNVVCEDKKTLNIPATVTKLNEWLAFQFGRGVEWQYKSIDRKIIVEKYLEGKSGRKMEYQVFCFNGKPVMIFVRNDLRCSSVDQHIEAFAVSYTPDWERVYYRKDKEQYQIALPKPHNYEKILNYVIRLSADFPQVRVDLYEINGAYIFWRIDFFPLEWNDSI